jgi:hypothetical protein
MPLVPTPVWGRDELRTGDMWNSNSVIAWLVERAGLDADSRRPPLGGRAPGWTAEWSSHAERTDFAQTERSAGLCDEGPRTL